MSIYFLFEIFFISNNNRTDIYNYFKFVVSLHKITKTLFEAQVNTANKLNKTIKIKNQYEIIPKTTAHNILL